jgi:hypothetical protein
MRRPGGAVTGRQHHHGARLLGTAAVAAEEIPRDGSGKPFTETGGGFCHKDDVGPVQVDAEAAAERRSTSSRAVTTPARSNSRRSDSSRWGRL